MMLSRTAVHHVLRDFRPSTLLAFLCLLTTGDACRGSGSGPVHFETEIRAIFRAHCFDCHGATEERQGALDLRLVRLVEQGGESGPALVRGKPDESLLLQRVIRGEMPPGEKKVTPAEIEILRRWIAEGAVTARPEPESIGPGLGITPEERSFWSFQPIRRPEIPDVSTFPAEQRIRTPVDALTIVSSAPEDIVPDADRRVLAIRASFDLTGLPPTSADLHKWINDVGDDWYDRMLGDLLNSPHYGEQWARHWLDVAGYADSEGHTVTDAERAWAWKYRDWVIRALNADKPFDRFILEQLAGDELAGPQNGDWTAEQIDLLTATGFLRMAADGTGSGADTPEGRNQVMTDTIKIVGTSLLGLSLQCAQCHDHRYDPIPQTDYYALRAVFEPALDWQSWQTPDARHVSLYTAADREAAAQIEAEAQKVAEERSSKQAEYMKQALDQELAKHDEALREQLRAAYETAADKRTDEQKQLLEKYPSVNITPGVLYQYLPKAAEELKTYDQKIGEIRGKKPVEEFLRVLVEPANHLPETKLFHRGDHNQPKQSVVPAALTVATPENQRVEFPLDDESLSTTGRRVAFAKWLASRDNPLFARVIVNRVWMHHFGKGLVATPADFGKLGVQPTHPELLDWLADEFIASGWSLKKLHRLIMTSTVYRQIRDPRSPFRPMLTRLEAETIRDRMLAATGQLDRTLFGRPLKISEDDTGQIVVDGNQTRRSLYIQVRRSQPVAMLQAFDAPVMETNCEVRSSSTVATQSLILLNGSFILDQAAKLADRAAGEAQPVAEDVRASLPQIPQPSSSEWTYGYGAFDAASTRTGSFTPLKHWNGSRWQAGAELPDQGVGWVLLHASGGHPDLPERGVIRRWTSPTDATVSITAKLSHNSPAGDGVRGRIVSSSAGLLGEWTIHNGAVDTPLSETPIKAGETLDFVTDCITNQTSDSFDWPVTITLKAAGKPDRAIVSTEQFSGPTESADSIPGQIVRAWQLAYCRDPSTEELQLASGFIARQMDLLLARPESLSKDRTALRQSMTNLCQSLLGSNEFLYVE